MTVTTVLALATLGDVTQIGSFLFVLCCTRWPREVLLRVAVADGFAYKLHQCKQSIMCVMNKLSCFSLGNHLHPSLMFICVWNLKSTFRVVTIVILTLLGSGVIHKKKYFQQPNVLAYFSKGQLIFLTQPPCLPWGDASWPSGFMALHQS